MFRLSSSSVAPRRSNRKNRTLVRPAELPLLAYLEILCCALALFALVAGPVYGTISAALFLAAAAGVVLVRPREAVRDLLRFLPLLAIPLLAMMSTAWSDAPERTVRAAIQMLLTMAAAIVICRRLSPETLIVLMFVAMVGMCLLALPRVPFVLETHYPLLGPYASKNAMAYAAHLLVALSLAVAFERKRSLWWRLAAVAAIGPALFLLKLAQSSGALLALILTLLTFPALLFVGRVNGIWRVVIVVLAILGVGVAVLLLPDIEAAAADFRQNVLQKDATLTGRTYLWDFAYRLAAEKPLLGHGYYAFWRIGNIDAEGLWRYAGIANRTGFNFHNTFIEMRVDMGWVGTILLVVTCAAILGLALFRQFTRPSTAMAFLAALTIGELVRSTAETSLFGPFSYYTLLLVATGVYAVTRDGLDPPAAGSRSLRRVSRKPVNAVRSATWRGLRSGAAAPAPRPSRALP